MLFARNALAPGPQACFFEKDLQKSAGKAPIGLDKRSPLWADYPTDAGEKKRYFC